MFGGKTLGRAFFFGVGYVAGTRAGRARYVQIEEWARAIVTSLRTRDNEDGGATSRDGWSWTSSTRGSDPYGDIKLGD